jgi:hypothetical protein
MEIRKEEERGRTLLERSGEGERREGVGVSVD